MTPALQVVIIRYLLGISTKVTTMNSSKRFNAAAWILSFAVVAISAFKVSGVEAVRCRNSHRGSI